MAALRAQRPSQRRSGGKSCILSHRTRLAGRAARPCISASTRVLRCAGEARSRNDGLATLGSAARRCVHCADMRKNAAVRRSLARRERMLGKEWQNSRSRAARPTAQGGEPGSFLASCRARYRERAGGLLARHRGDHASTLPASRGVETAGRAQVSSIVESTRSALSMHADAWTWAVLETCWTRTLESNRVAGMKMTMTGRHVSKKREWSP